MSDILEWQISLILVVVKHIRGDEKSIHLLKFMLILKMRIGVTLT